MKFEHLALNVPEVTAMGHWYAQHLGLTVLRRREDAPFTQFLGDETGRVFLEIYSNPAAPCLDFAATHPLVLHVAFFVTNAEAERTRLVAAGAKPFSEETAPDGTRLMFLRDPWGVPLQLCQRAKPFPGY